MIKCSVVKFMPFKSCLLVYMAVSYNSSTKVFDTFGGGA